MIKNNILKLLQKRKQPISVPEILEEISANKTTIYRELSDFMKNGLVTEVEFGDGKKRYEAKRQHHHHLICNFCGKIQDVKFDENKLFTNLNEKSKFKIQNHNIEFFGVCLNCQ